jgi:hypothetical protein
MRHIARTLVPLLFSLVLVAGSVSALPATVSAARVPSSPALTSLLVAVRQTLAQTAAFRVRVTGGSLLGSAVRRQSLEAGPSTSRRSVAR